MPTSPRSDDHLSMRDAKRVWLAKFELDFLGFVVGFGMVAGLLFLLWLMAGCTAYGKMVDTVATPMAQPLMPKTVNEGPPPWVQGRTK